MRRPVWSFPSLLVSLPPLPPFISASFSRLHRFREGFDGPAEVSPGEDGGIWVVSPPLPGRSSPLSLVGESCPHSRPLYSPWLAPLFRRLLSRLGEAWPSLSKVVVVRLPLRLAFLR